MFESLPDSPSAFYNSILVWGGLLMMLGLLLTAATLKELGTKT